MAPFEALYGRKCRSPICWDDIGEREVLGPELLQQTVHIVSLVQKRMRAAQSRQKSYADDKRRPLNFDVDDLVFLRVSPTRGVMRFGLKGKLSPHFVGPFRIIAKVGEVAYKLELPPSLSGVHNVFHVSSLRRYVADPSHILEPEPLQLRENLTYEEVPVQILDRKEQILRSKTIPMVKVLWRSHSLEEATWELESEIRTKYPHLFSLRRGWTNESLITSLIRRVGESLYRLLGAIREGLSYLYRKRTKL